MSIPASSRAVSALATIILTILLVHTVQAQVDPVWGTGDATGQGEPAASEVSLTSLVFLFAIIVFLVALSNYLVVKHTQAERSGNTDPRGFKAAMAITLVLLLGATGVFAADMFTVEEAPEFTVRTIDGQTINLSDYQGKVVLIEFMSTTCPTCKKALATMQEVYPDYEDDIEVLLVSVDGTDSPSLLRTYRDSYDVEWPIAMDVNNHITPGYAVSAIPRVIIVDEEGLLTFDALGAPDEEELRGKLTDTINKEARTVTTYSFKGAYGLYIVAALAGAGMFFAPCAFPLLPGYLTFTFKKKDIEGTVKDGLMIGSVASAGIVVVFVVLGLLVASARAVISDKLYLLQPIVGAVLMIVGYSTLRKSTVLDRFRASVGAGFRRLLPDIEALRKDREGSNLDIFLYGIGYASGASACMAPVLFGIVLIGLTTGGFMGGFLTFTIAALAMASMMILFSVFATTSGRQVFERYADSSASIEKVSAVIILVVGVVFVGLFFTYL